MNLDTREVLDELERHVELEGLLLNIVAERQEMRAKLLVEIANRALKFGEGF